MISPIYNLKGIVQALLEWVKQDFDKFDNEEDSWLYQFIHLGERDGDVEEFYLMAKEIFLRRESSRNMLTVELEFPKDTTILPVIVLREPSRVDGDTNIIGATDSEVISLSGGAQMQVFRDSKRFNYDLMCVGLNYKETLIISDTLYGLLVGAYNTFARDYEKVSFSLREMLVNSELNPYPTFIRTVGLDLQRSNFIPSIERKIYLDSIRFEAKIETRTQIREEKEEEKTRKAILQENDGPVLSEEDQNLLVEKTVWRRKEQEM